MSSWRHALSWYPGHVAKATREMERRLCSVDIVLDVRDARAPRSSASTQLERLIRGAKRESRHIIVVNKSDLVSSSHRSKIAAWMNEDHADSPVFFTSAMVRRGAGHGRTVGVREVLDAAIDHVRKTSPRLFSPRDASSSLPPPSAISRAISDAAASALASSAMPTDASLPLMMMVVGVPNVGKSSLINAFRLLGTGSDGSSTTRRAPSRPRSRMPAKTGALPGVTTTLSGFQVCWDPTVWMLDTPGVLAPRVDGGWEGALRLAALDLLKYGAHSKEDVASYLLHHLVTTDAAALDRFPRTNMAMAAMARSHEAATVGAAEHLHGAGPDPFAGSSTAGEVVFCPHERRAMRMLAELARDFNLFVKRRSVGHRRDRTQAHT